MPLTINGVVHNDGDPLLVDGVQAELVTVNGVTVWENYTFDGLWVGLSTALFDTIEADVNGDLFIASGGVHVGVVTWNGTDFTGESTTQGSTSVIQRKIRGVVGGVQVAQSLADGSEPTPWSDTLAFDSVTGFAPAEIVSEASHADTYQTGLKGEGFGLRIFTLVDGANRIDGTGVVTVS